MPRAAIRSRSTKPRARLPARFASAPSRVSPRLSPGAGPPARGDCARASADSKTTTTTQIRPTRSSSHGSGRDAHRGLARLRVEVAEDVVRIGDALDLVVVALVPRRPELVARVVVVRDERLDPAELAQLVFHDLVVVLRAVLLHAVDREIEEQLVLHAAIEAVVDPFVVADPAIRHHPEREVAEL